MQCRPDLATGALRQNQRSKTQKRDGLRAWRILSRRSFLRPRHCPICRTATTESCHRTVVGIMAAVCRPRQPQWPVVQPLPHPHRLPSHRQHQRLRKICCRCCPTPRNFPPPIIPPQIGARNGALRPRHPQPPHPQFCHNRCLRRFPQTFQSLMWWQTDFRIFCQRSAQYQRCPLRSFLGRKAHLAAGLWQRKAQQ